MSGTTDSQQSTEPTDVSASEAAAFAFCAKAWHLERVLAQRVSNAGQSQRTMGVEHHQSHGARVGRLVRFGRPVAIVSALLIALSIALLLLAARLTVH